MASSMNEFNEKVIDEFRRSGGKVGGQFAGAPMIVITHTGAKSGKTYTSPLVYSRDGDRYEVGGETFTVKAIEATGPERDRLFAAHAKMMPVFNEYQKKTTRKIPVVVLERTK